MTIKIMKVFAEKEVEPSMSIELGGAEYHLVVKESEGEVFVKLPSRKRAFNLGHFQVRGETAAVAIRNRQTEFTSIRDAFVAFCVLNLDSALLPGHTSHNVPDSFE